MILANLETRSYMFTALATDEQEARLILRRAWAKHCAETGASASFDQIADDNIEYLPIACGDVLRDKTPFYSR